MSSTSFVEQGMLTEGTPCSASQNSGGGSRFPSVSRSPSAFVGAVPGPWHRRSPLFTPCHVSDETPRKKTRGNPGPPPRAPGSLGPRRAPSPGGQADVAAFAPQEVHAPLESAMIGDHATRRPPPSGTSAVYLNKSYRQGSALAHEENAGFGPAREWRGIATCPRLSGSRASSVWRRDDPELDPSVRGCPDPGGA